MEEINTNEDETPAQDPEDLPQRIKDNIAAIIANDIDFVLPPEQLLERVSGKSKEPSAWMSAKFFVVILIIAVIIARIFVIS